MTQEEIPLLVLRGLEGNEPTRLHGLQIYMAPYLQEIMAFWWAVFAATLMFVSTKYVFLPLLRKWFPRSAAETSEARETSATNA